MSRSTLSLSATARTALERLCHTATQPYLRERAAAILTVAAGQSATRVARAGLLQPRKVEAVCRGLARYRAEGVAGLTIRPGRGLAPAFSPQQPDTAAARAARLDVLGREPRQCGVERTRGQLGDRQAQCPWLRLASLSGLSPLLRRLRISFQQGRRHVHSPALNYQPKRQAVERRQSAAHWAAQEAGWDGWLPRLLGTHHSRRLNALEAGCHTRGSVQIAGEWSHQQRGRADLT